MSLATSGAALLRRSNRHGPLVESPGSATGWAVAVALAAQIIRSVQFEVASGRSLSAFLSYHEAFTSDFWISLPRTAGYTVAVWWLSMALRGRWSEEPCATSRLGLALGWCWLTLAVSSEVGIWCFALNY